MPRKVIVAVHGMGDQFRYTSIQSVANQMCRYFGLPDALPVGRFHSKLFEPPTETAAPLAALTTATKNLVDSLERQAADEVAPRVKAVQELLKKAAEAAPVVSALVLEPPDVPALPADFGFAEVYWAHIPRAAVKDEYVLEETTRWGRTVVERLRLQYVAADAREQLDDDRYELAATVIDEVVETVRVLGRLPFLADKAGLFQFPLQKQLDDYLGDVQIVTEFAHHRKGILDGFDKIMRQVKARWATDAEDPELYVVAHSEGTVVAFLGLLDALKRQPGARRPRSRTG